MIRPLKQTDYMAAKHIFQENFHSTEEPHFISAWRKRTPEKCLGYWHTNVLIAAAIVGANKLHYIYTHNNFKGNGVGTRLLKAVLEQNPNIYLTPVANTDIQRWYIHHGFHLSQQMGEYKIFVRHAHNTRKIR